MAEILVKKLSPNDTSNSIHQAGIYVSKEDKVLSFFPPLDETGKNPRVELLFTDDEGNEWTFNYIHYNNKIRSGGTRDEYRLTIYVISIYRIFIQINAGHMFQR